MANNSPFQPKARQNSLPKAEAFGNCAFTGADGEEYKIPKGMPMDSGNRVTRSIINAARAAAEKGEDLVIEMKCTVKLVVDDSGLEDIQIV